MREENLRQTAEMLAKSEAGRPARLQRSLEFIPADLKRQAAAFERDLKYADIWWKRQLRHWPEHDQEYRREAKRLLWGQPEEIERSAIIMFF